MLNWYGFSSNPSLLCDRSIRASTFSSRRALARLDALCLPHSFAATTNDNAIPLFPPRAVLPTLCTYVLDDVGRSKFSTHATFLKSTPRETPTSPLVSSPFDSSVAISRLYTFLLNSSTMCNREFNGSSEFNKHDLMPKFCRNSFNLYPLSSSFTNNRILPLIKPSFKIT
ncbi:hypothetical protein OGAPHI_003055 [Ogataea philodendri]|uniref:Uncharacterized protein n=1 Tax=Ogataea philodendri TaxID=1378263 RepID=A0A9P8P951_9ASCO|nr:uncharacterized protein OGAPHI_003055 [Ogataea philodendri]KAH3667406.1 hypothetical protein OGAPHI_003055 [Ogataea philodendri]